MINYRLCVVIGSGCSAINRSLPGLSDSGGVGSGCVYRYCNPLIKSPARRMQISMGPTILMTCMPMDCLPYRTMTIPRKNVAQTKNMTNDVTASRGFEHRPLSEQFADASVIEVLRSMFNHRFTIIQIQ